MSENGHSTPLDRLWNRLEERYGTEEFGQFGCDCAGGSGTVEVLEASSLTRRDLEAYRNGDATMTELVAMLDADVDPGAIDDLEALVTALEDVDGEDGTDASARA